MSLSDRKSSPALRRMAMAAGAIVLGLGLSGCFRPLYGDATLATTGGSVKANLTEIEVLPIQDRIGHYLRNELVFDLDGSGLEKTRRYQLSVTVAESLDVVVTDYSTGRADSATLVATATYKLSEKDKVLFSGTSVSRATYDRSAQRFANLRAARDAQIRAAKSLSGLIRNRLAASFAGGF